MASEVNTLLTVLCILCVYMLAGGTNSWDWLQSFHVFYFKLLTKKGEAVWGFQAWCIKSESSPRPFTCPFGSMPNAPLRDSWSLFDPYSFLPAGRPEDANSPFPSHTFFPKDQEVLTHSCSGISYTEIGQTCQAIWMSSHPLLPFITLRSSELDSQL